ncbi:MAG: hypothetical protein GYA60_01530 [Candidatus Methanofastidiosa archaeon]|nr:hypothetical protein [Candidatus Methanofastidiosa archaeon]
MGTNIIHLDSMFLIKFTYLQFYTNFHSVYTSPKEIMDKMILKNDEKNITKKVFKALENSKYSPYISTIVMGEIFHAFNKDLGSNCTIFCKAFQEFFKNVFFKYRFDIYYPPPETYKDILELHSLFQGVGIDYNDSIILANSITDCRCNALITLDSKILERAGIILAKSDIKTKYGDFSVVPYI